MPNKPGRPEKPANERRTITKAQRWSADELELLEARAEAAGLDVSKFVRMSALGQMDGKTR